MKYMLDTNIFNKLVEGIILLSDLPLDGVFMATYVQIEELKKTPDSSKRAQLLLKFEEITSIQIPTESFVKGKSPRGQAKRTKKDNIAQLIQSDLDKLKRNQTILKML